MALVRYAIPASAPPLRSILAVLILAAASQSWASASVQGQAHEYPSPGGTTERCVVLARMPGGVYDDADTAEEESLCGIDFHDGSHALCPKVFSTSPGTLVYDLRGGAFAGKAQEFEQTHCAEGGVRKGGAQGAPVAWKMSVNTRVTSATFANASLVYYHFARYFDATAHVPAAVMRTMDRGAHSRRVSARGLALSAGRSALKMNHAAWQALHDAEGNPAGYTPTEELFTPDGQVYGVMLRPVGTRYSEEMNGTRASGWGDGQNRDFQETAPFRALRSEQPLLAAIAEGRREALKDPRLAKATGADATPQQMAIWMSDLIDITLLDFIFSQQDRIGNIDYVPYWHWVQDGRLMRRPASGKTPPADIAVHAPLLLKRTELGDNDAGVRLSYANYTRRTQMLEKLRHYRAATYERLLRLHRDFQSGGALHDYVRGTFGLSEKEFRQVVANTAAATAMLHAGCTAGKLRFDVEAEEFLLTGGVKPRSPDCGSL